MGEIAEMMLDGTLCEGCGTYLGEAEGYIRYCPACSSCSEEPKTKIIGHPPRVKAQCSECGKWVKETGLAQHIFDKHKLTTETE